MTSVGEPEVEDRLVPAQVSALPLRARTPE